MGSASLRRLKAHSRDLKGISAFTRMESRHELPRGIVPSAHLADKTWHSEALRLSPGCGDRADIPGVRPDAQTSEANAQGLHLSLLRSSWAPTG